ncbi:protein-disulfide reductase DsbD [Stenoxybacter acetivorans]|uniref:protein-disulfide reductase DsbD n=1 Tax=Stenoxybacter acetivorans TaxID=422441 RepID=UPI00069030E1|nr:protein-disulfide reductase DsbD [Stenoxybacter acetivorans]
MLKKWLGLAFLLLGLFQAAWAIDASKLLSADKAFVPQLTVGGDKVSAKIAIAEGYYLYREKIFADTDPAGQLVADGQFPIAGQEKNDEFFGKQEVYHHEVEVNWLYQPNAKRDEPFTVTLEYQGCADVGVCYPPAAAVFYINGDGTYRRQSVSAGQPFLENNPQNSVNPTLPPRPVNTDSSRFKLSWETLSANLLAFFVAGLGLSLTACMYPLLPIVSGIVLGGQNHSKRRALLLSVLYVQGLAITYAAVGITAGLTGALVTVWLQQAWVVLAASAVLVLLALAMFGVYSIQLPNRVQAFFQTQSSRLGGGKLVSVLVMGIFSALIVGPCVAPPLAFALGYIGQTGDAVLGGLALYVLALGTGLPLIAVAVFGSHILPRSGSWMNGIKYTFGILLLAAAIYLATPFLPYGVVVIAYVLLLLIPAGLLLVKARVFSGSLKTVSNLLGVLLLVAAVYFAAGSVRQESTIFHRALTLYPSDEAHFGRSFFHPDDVRTAMEAAFAEDAKQPVLVDFYADWCVSCKEMAAYTFSDAKVKRLLNEDRFLQIDVTANTPVQQAMLKEYGLFGPPGLFVVYADGSRSEPLLGYVPLDAFLQWYNDLLSKR